MKYAVIIMLACLLVLVCHDAFTDILYLKNGTQREGTIMSQDEKKVVLRIGDEKDGIDVAFSSEEVLRIDKVGAEQTIEVPFAQGPKIRITPPLIRGTPLFANLTRPIIPGVEQRVNTESSGGAEEIRRLDTQSKITSDSFLVHDAENERVTAKDDRIRDNLKKYLSDRTNTTQ